MSKRSDIVRMLDMREAAQRTITYCADLDYDAFLRDTKTQDAVVRNIEILGEAAKGVSEETRRRFTAIPWRSVAGMRDRLIHDYRGVNWDIVWDTVTRDLPKLLAALDSPDVQPD